MFLSSYEWRHENIREKMAMRVCLVSLEQKNERFDPKNNSDLMCAKAGWYDDRRRKSQDSVPFLGVIRKEKKFHLSQTCSSTSWQYHSCSNVYCRKRAAWRNPFHFRHIGHQFGLLRVISTSSYSPLFQTSPRPISFTLSVSQTTRIVYPLKTLQYSIKEMDRKTLEFTPILFFREEFAIRHTFLLLLTAPAIEMPTRMAHSHLRHQNMFLYAREPKQQWDFSTLYTQH